MTKKLSENILIIIGQLISKTNIIFSRESLSQKLRQLDIAEDIDQRSLNRSLKRFNEQGLIKIIDKKAKSNYTLTEKGIRKLADFDLKNRDAERWDGLWRVVIFDIPEDKKIVREALRRKLKYFNFFPLQKSVFVYPFVCENEIDELADFFQIREHLDTLLVKSLGHKEGEIRNFFQIGD